MEPDALPRFSVSISSYSYALKGLFHWGHRAIYALRRLTLKSSLIPNADVVSEKSYRTKL